MHVLNYQSNVFEIYFRFSRISWKSWLSWLPRLPRLPWLPRLHWIPRISQFPRSCSSHLHHSLSAPSWPEPWKLPLLPRDLQLNQLLPPTQLSCYTFSDADATDSVPPSLRRHRVHPRRVLPLLSRYAAAELPTLLARSLLRAVPLQSVL